MSAALKSPPSYLTYADIAELLGHSVGWVKLQMPAWEKRGFPAPAPWWKRQKRWHAGAVRAWLQREEQRAGAHGAPDLRLIEGGAA